MAQQVPRFIELLSKDHRVILLGGLAVIAHGRDRHTHDVDIWLDPLNSAESWSNVIADACRAFPEASVHRLPGWVQVIDQGIADAADETGMIRVLGLGMPLDIFRRPKEFEETGFDAVFQRATRNDDGTYLPDPLDLLQSKLDTDREKDLHDIQHLESVVRRRYFAQLPTASLADATDMLDRFSDWQVLRAALTNPDSAVQDLARRHLHEFAELGDPFSQAILANREIPG